MNHLRTLSRPARAATGFEPILGLIDIIESLLSLPSFIIGNVNDGVLVVGNSISNFSNLVIALNNFYCGNFFDVVIGKPGCDSGMNG
jgi:hypothetical protein